MKKKRWGRDTKGVYRQHPQDISHPWKRAFSFGNPDNSLKSGYEP